VVWVESALWAGQIAESVQEIALLLARGGFVLQRVVQVVGQVSEITEVLRDSISCCSMVFIIGKEKDREKIFEGMARAVDLPSIDEETISSKNSPPLGIERLKDSFGSGYLLLREDCGGLISLFGPPFHMEMVFSQVLLLLRQRGIVGWKSHTLFFFLLGEGAISSYISKLKRLHVQVDLLPLLHFFFLYIRSNPQSKEEEILIDDLKQEFVTHLFSSTSPKIEHALHEQLIENKKTLVLAESCTGGDLAARLTKLPNSSYYLRGSAVVYSNRMKERWLGINSSLLHRCGPVSAEVVCAMAIGGLESSDADYVIAISGIAGPSGGNIDQPVGTIWGAIGCKGGEVFTKKMHLEGSREKRIKESGDYLFGSLWRYLAHRVIPFTE